MNCVAENNKRGNSLRTVTYEQENKCVGSNL